MKKVLSVLNIIASLMFFVSLVVTFLYPEVVEKLKLTPVESKVIIMNTISLILLLNFMQKHLRITWRIFCLIASFIVLIESILMLGAWQQLLTK